MSDTPNYVEYIPPADGVPPNGWREGMLAAHGKLPWSEAERYWEPSWYKGQSYKVEPEALTAPNEDAKLDGWAIGGALSIIRAMSPDELAKHGITLAPERDWATELWDVLITTWQNAGNEWEGDQAAIALIRERVQLKEARND